MIDTWIIENADDVQVILFLVLFVLFWMAEGVIPKRTGPMHRRERWLVNLWLTWLNVAVLSLLLVTFFGIAVWGQKQDVGLFNYTTLPMSLLIIGTLLARGFIHYLMHREPLFWLIHRVIIWIRNSTC